MVLPLQDGESRWSGPGCRGHSILCSYARTLAHRLEFVKLELSRLCPFFRLLLKASVLSQKFAYKVFLMRAVFSQPRQGRKMVAQGASPGGGPSPRLRPPSPGRRGDRGDGGEGGLADPRLAPWATFFRPSADGLTYSTNF